MIRNESLSSTSAVVVVKDLVQIFQKRRRQYVAVDHLNFYVPQGSCFGLLGT
jgi:ABC-type oligopeptide transport system ATPase subunit